MNDIQIIENLRQMQTFSESQRLAGKTIALVPTMGYLHAGHLSLIEKGRERGNPVIISIFVNPTQFGPGEDLDKYPQSFEKDVEMAQKHGAHVVFAPQKDALYPPDYQTFVALERLPAHLCGISRPVHFRGVATIVTKLFNIVKPHVAVFGEKDFQQLLVIRQMVRDLNFDIEIVGAPIVRESDGLAMSSRNAYLNDGQRKSATSLFQSLKAAQALVAQGIFDSRRIIDAAEAVITSYPETKIDYIRLCDPENLEAVESVKGQALLALAVKIGTTRLIDNMILTS